MPCSQEGRIISKCTLRFRNSNILFFRQIWSFVCLKWGRIDDVSFLRGKIISKCRYSGGDPVSIIYELLCNPPPQLAWPQLAEKQIFYSQPPTTLIFTGHVFQNACFEFYFDTALPLPPLFGHIIYMAYKFICHVNISKVIWCPAAVTWRFHTRGRMGIPVSRHNDGGMTPGEGPKFVTFPIQGIWSFLLFLDTFGRLDKVPAS